MTRDAFDLEMKPEAVSAPETTLSSGEHPLPTQGGASPLPAAFADALLSWFSRRKRDLPWRNTNDPYAVWVSEIMLQQTRVAAVIPYYRRFMERFPTLGDLAGAPEEEVLRLWAGLGYYSRARGLRQGAREVMMRHAGRVPSDPADLIRLPGVGPYTAGAIASIAYNVSTPVVDGNVMRVLCRLLALSGDPKRNPLHRRLWEIAGNLLPEGRAREFNPAMMELGATICTPRSPSCGGCPVSAFCEAYRRGATERYPETPSPPAPEPMTSVCGLLICPTDRSVLLVRPDDSRWRGLWQLPGAVLEPGEDPGERLVEVLAGMGYRATALKPFLRIRHDITRFRFTLHSFEGSPAGSEPSCGAGTGSPSESVPARWVAGSELLEVPLPAPHRKIARAWLERPPDLWTPRSNLPEDPSLSTR